MAKNNDDPLRIEKIGKSTRIVLFLNTFLLFCIVGFSLWMAFYLRKSYPIQAVAILITVIPSAFGTYMVSIRAILRKAEAENIVRMQVASTGKLTPEQVITAVKVVNEHELGSDTTGKPESGCGTYEDTPMEEFAEAVTGGEADG